MASGHEGAKAPFLNDYKLQFFKKRFRQTVTGGLRLKIDAPYYVYVYQLIVFLWPAILGGIFTVLSEFELLPDHICCYIFAGLIGLTVTCVYLLRLYLARNGNTKGSQTSRRNILADDDETDFSSCCNGTTFLFMFPAKIYPLLHGVVLSVLCGMTFLYLLPSRLQDLGYDTGSTIILLIFNWLTLCIASYSLSVHPPPETAIFRSLDSMGLNAFMRPFYVACIAVVGVLARHYSSLEEIGKVLYIVMAILPLLWIVGLLPPLDALFPWLGEQVLVFALGGSYMASDCRLVIAFLLSALALIPAYFITNYVVLATYAAVIGLVLSLDLFHITEFIVNCVVKKQLTHSRIPTITTILKYGTLLVICGSIAGVTSHYDKWLPLNSTKNMFDVFGIVFLVLLLLLKVLGDLQYVYVASGLVRNPFYIKSATSVGGLKKFQHKIGYIGHVYNVLLSFICPLIIVPFLCTFLKSSFHSEDLSSFFKILGIIRALRWAWQNTFKCLVEVTICVVLVWIELFIDTIWWNKLDIGLQLMLIGIVTDRLNEFVTKMKFMLTVYITSWTEVKQRHFATVPTLITSLILFPLVLATLTVSVALSSPITPLFCFPVFFIGFPRPKRMWPSLTAQSSNGSEGSVFYQQLVPKICEELQRVVANGSLVTKSDFMLVRYQDRLIVVQILERGYKYCTLIARGLELQETSCHTVEAARVDDVFEDVFTKDRTSACGINPYPMHTLTPLNCLVVETYSDAHNVLTGVIDQPENIQKQSVNFMKCLVWVLLNHQKNEKANDGKDSSVLENTEGLETSEVTEFKDDNFPLQNTQTTLCELQSEENLKSASKTTEMNTKQTKIFSDADWSDKEWSADSESSDSEDETTTKPSETLGDDPLMFFGLPAQDLGSQTRLNSGTRHKSGGIFPNRKITPISVDLGVQHTPPGDSGPSTWSNLLQPCRKYLPQMQSEFPEEWFGYVASKVREDKKAEETDDEVQLNVYRDVSMYCYAVINICGLHGNVLDAGPAHISRVFQDRIPWSPELDLLEQDGKLKQLVLKAYRYAFKLTYDEAVLGPVDDHLELEATLKDYEEDWFIGIENKPGWNEAILQEKPNLFTIGYDADKATYTSHLLTKQELTLYTATLNSEAVNGQWSSMAFELLYLTNDDEERYSIQAHPVLLRNLTMQAADPPLGYAVYSSGPAHITHDWM